MLIELLLVIAVGAVLIVVIVRAVDPATRMKQARDAKRKADINVIANAIVQYQAMNAQYPRDTSGINNDCDSSKGVTGDCPGTGSYWSTDLGGPREGLYAGLIGNDILKQLPLDPVNDSNYYYRYEPQNEGESPCNTESPGKICRYWIGARLEKPSDVSKPIFRCSDRSELAAGPGCKEVGGSLTILQ